jgi:hypothetical protein
MNIKLNILHGSCKNQEKFRKENNTVNLPQYHTTIEGQSGTTVLACEACGDRICIYGENV